MYIWVRGCRNTMTNGYAWMLLVVFSICFFIPASSYANCHNIKYCCGTNIVDTGDNCTCICYPWICDPSILDPDPCFTGSDDLLCKASNPCADNPYCDEPSDSKVNSCEASESNPDSPSPLEGKPVNMFSGAETFVRTDLTLGNFYPIAIVRRYNSGSEYTSQLGYGWGTSFDKRIYTYADGSVVLREDAGWKRRFTASGNTYVSPVGESGTLTQNADGTFKLVQKSGDKENYDIQGRLSSIADIRGNSLVVSYEDVSRSPLWGLLQENVVTTPLIISYDYRILKVEEKDATDRLTGVRMNFQYDSASGKLTNITDSAGRSVTYLYDNYGNLTSVSGPNGIATYTYGDAFSVHHMIGIDEGSGIYTNQYDSRGRVIKQSHAGGDITFEYLQPKRKTKATTTIKDSSGVVLSTRVRTLDFDINGQISRDTDTYGNANNYAWNANAWITYQDYLENTGTVDSPDLMLRNAATYTYDSQGNVLTKTVAVGYPLETTTTYTYHPTFNKIATETVKSVVTPAQNRVTTYSYNPSTGNLQSVNVSGLLNPTTPFSYTTTYGYDSVGRLTSITGPRADVQDVTSVGYDPVTGFLSTITRPAIGATTYSNHDGLGNPRTVADPNGQMTTYTYDTVGRILTAKAPGDSNPTQFFYTTAPCGSCGDGFKTRLNLLIMPEGNRVDFGYDAAGNLINIIDTDGNSINYKYDSEGNRLSDEIKDASGVLQKTLSYTYDALNRPKRIVNPDSTYTEYGYDFMGRRTSLKDPKGQNSTNQYDILNRLTTVIQPSNITTTLGYTTNGNLASLRDGNNNATVYKFDDMGRVYQSISPDTGTTSYSYDPSGNMVSRTDAKGVTISYQYDALNRLMKVDFPSDTDTVYTYDACMNGNGHLCSMTDASGSTSYEYTAKGELKKETRIIDGISYVTQYTYDMNGNIATVTYPSGRIITYGYANDRVSSISSTLIGINATLASSITYKPFGKMKSLIYGNGVTGTITYDNQYRMAGISTGSLQGLVFGYDANSNVNSITNTFDYTKNKGYGYDALDRLTSGTGPWGSLSWTYDGVGNRLTEGANSYLYTVGTNKLNNANGKSYTYDNNGNTTNEGTRTNNYNENQRLLQTSDGTITATYTYNGNGERVKKVVGGTTTIFHYDLGGRLIAESNADGTITVEYVYLNGNPLAMIFSGSTYFYHNDHLGVPQKMTDSTGAVVWSTELKPFGETQNITGTITNNLRFPGQYYDSETGLHYNYLRDYNPIIGKYLEVDPIGQWGGINVFSYVQNNPVNNTDPSGLFRSNSFLRGLVPGQIYFDNGMSSLENGDYLGAGINLASMIGEQLLFVGTLGSSSMITRSVNSSQCLAKAAPSYTRSSLQMGQQMHKTYKLGANGFKEFRLPSGMRIDFLDIENGIIYELKPFNPRAIQAGQRQLQMYKEELMTMPQFKGINWRTVLETY
jgi:RHS repeat-associated protein